MTIAPTIYAGFIVRGFNQIPDLFKSDFGTILKDNMEAADLSPEAMQVFQQVVRTVSAMLPPDLLITQIY
ncbi:hypothetical protein UACE39S_00205 [Ureibacillus acetophenoni]